MFKSIILLYSLINTGDVSHGKSIIDKLAQESQTEVMVIDANLPETELQAEYQKIKTKLHANHSIVLAIGEKGLLALSTLNKTQHFQDPKVKLGASLHMYFDVIETLPLDFLAIPETESKKGSIKQIPHSVLTLTVPSKNPTQEELKIAYDNWDIAITKKPSTQNAYIVVMLPGDAVDQNGKMKYFTKESAKQLFDKIVTLRNKHGKKHTVIVQNGARTGKFNPENGAILCAHEYEKGHNPDIAIDGITQYFIKLLEQESISHHFFNFAFEIEGKTKKALSVFNQLLYIAQSNNDNFFIIPGESVSMLGQIPIYLQPKQVIVFKPDSMNTSHEAIFEVIKNRGHLSYFSDQNTVLAPKYSVKMENDDATTVTKALIKVFAPKHASFASDENRSSIGNQSTPTQATQPHSASHPKKVPLVNLLAILALLTIPTGLLIAYSAPIILTILIASVSTYFGVWCSQKVIGRNKLLTLPQSFDEKLNSDNARKIRAFTPNEIHAFNVGVDAGKSTRGYFNAWTIKDSYSHYSMYAIGQYLAIEGEEELINKFKRSKIVPAGEPYSFYRKS